MGMFGKCHDLTSLPPGKIRYPLTVRLDRHQGRSGGMQTILPTDIQSQYCPAHSETHLYEYISLITMFVQKYLKETQYMSNDPCQWRSKSKSYQQEITEIWKYLFKICFLRNNLLYVHSLWSLIL
jgi:hypothetical protein